jgi:hypothetical protein
VYEVDPSQVILKSRLKPGRMLLVDTREKCVIQDVELKQRIARSRPHSEWLKEQVISKRSLVGHHKRYGLPNNFLLETNENL